MILCRIRSKLAKRSLWQYLVSGGMFGILLAAVVWNLNKSEWWLKSCIEYVEQIWADVSTYLFVCNVQSYVQVNDDN